MIALVTVYQPGPALARFVEDLRDLDTKMGVVVVDDGSGPPSAAALAAVSELGATVLRRATHVGKGAALKAGIAYVIAEHPGQDVVCADPDGQHRVTDVRRIADCTAGGDAIVLGVRRFDGSVPWRSRLGNAMTRRLFRVVTRRDVGDTQTGLRGYPAGRLDWLRTVPGEQFDYEFNVLLYAASAGVPIEELTIPTIYSPGNGSSHFHAVADSVRIYWSLVRFAAARMSASAPIRRPNSSTP
jgi:glycosyltransferase involved in cell wall biosynthesis